MTFHILVVEDDADMRDLLAEVFKEEAYAVTTVGHGQDALDHLRSAATLPDLIIVDMHMPVMGGHEFRAEQLKNLAWANIDTLILSGDAKSHLGRADLRFTEVIKKPLELNSFLATIKKYALAHNA